MAKQPEISKEALAVYIPESQVIQQEQDNGSN